MCKLGRQIIVILLAITFANQYGMNLREVSAVWLWLQCKTNGCLEQKDNSVVTPTSVRIA